MFIIVIIRVFRKVNMNPDKHWNFNLFMIYFVFDIFSLDSSCLIGGSVPRLSALCSTWMLVVHVINVGAECNWIFLPTSVTVTYLLLAAVFIIVLSCNWGIQWFTSVLLWRTRVKNSPDCVLMLITAFGGYDRSTVIKVNRSLDLWPPQGEQPISLQQDP